MRTLAPSSARPRSSSTTTPSGGRLERINATVRGAITGTAPTAEQTIAAMAALGSLWRPITRYQSVERLREHLVTAVESALAGLGRA
jgi:hypothetical protein